MGAQYAKQRHIDRLGLNLSGIFQSVWANQHPIGFEDMANDVDLVRRDDQQAIGFAARDHRAVYVRAETDIAGDGAAALTHPVNLAFLDVQSGAEGGIGKDVGRFDHALATQAGYDDVRNIHIAHFDCLTR